MSNEARASSESSWSNPQYGAAFYIFENMRDHSTREICWRYVLPNGGGIDTERLLDISRAWSHGEQILVKVAVDLFSPHWVQECGHEPANVGEIVNTLDDTNLRVVLNAMKVARGEVHAIDLLKQSA